MAQDHDTVSVAKAASMLGVTDDAVRKQIQRDDLQAIVADGLTRVMAEPVRRRRAELLARLGAVEPGSEVTGELQVLRDEVQRKGRLIVQLQAMNAELATARAATDRALAIAQAALVERELPLDARELEAR
jgi:septal ring factor EnvC (AmiA/AmiB activator)